MSGQGLLLIILALAAVALLFFYNLTMRWPRGKSSIYYNLGMPCPDGVEASPCPYCGQVFGDEVIEAARQKCEEDLKASAADHGSSGLNLDLFQIIRWDVDCASCGRKSSYVPQARLLLHSG